MMVGCHHVAGHNRMFRPSQIRLDHLASLCRRLATATEAGIDARKTWSGEAERGPTAVRTSLGRVRDAVAVGESVTDAVLAATPAFPSLFCEMVDVGERTGKLAEVYRRLADFYDYQIRMRRIFWAGISWPLIELGIAVVVIAFVIWIPGLVSRGDTPVDILGFGLVGTRGLVIYLLVVNLAALAVLAVVHAARRGKLWTRPLQRALLVLPGVGPCFNTMALSRFAWTLQLTLDVALDVRRGLSLALHSTGNDRYTGQVDRVTQDLKAGHEIHEALENTGVFPAEFLAMVEVGEQSGKIVDVMGRLADQYEDRAKAAMRNLTVMGGFLVWGLVAITIVFMIFRIAAFYINAIGGAN